MDGPYEQRAGATGLARDRIRIDGLRLACIVGLRPDEREQEQPVDLDVELGLDLSRAGRSGRIHETCDYDRVADEIRALLRFRRYRLIESAVEELAALLLGVHEHVRWVRIRLCKPRALDGRARGAAVEITRRAEDFPRRREDASFGRVDVLLETEEAGLYLLRLAPGAEIPRHHHQVMRELEWRVAGDVARNGRRLRGLEPVVWSKGQIHGYRNLSPTDEAVLFCCDTPPFVPEDEIAVSDRAGEERR